MTIDTESRGDWSGDGAELERLARVDEIVTAAVAEAREGQPIDVDAVAAAHPDLSGDLRRAFRGVHKLERAVQFREDEAERAIVPGSIGPYQVLRELGRGGMGIVYEAEDASLGRTVAIKLLPRSFSRNHGLVERFQREARAAARLEHSNVVPVFRVEEAEGQHFIVMKLVDGHGLDALLGFYADGTTSFERGASPSDSDSHLSVRRIAEELAVKRLGAFESSSDAALDAETDLPLPDVTPTLGRLYYRNVARVGLSCASALGYAHGRGVLHRDIKPGNILVDKRGHVWITDFGLAKLDEADDLTREGDFIGTLRYTSPEQFQGHAEARSDVYGLGLVLYELLTQRRALQSDSRAELVNEVLYQVPTSPDLVRPGVPQDLARIVMKAIAKLPEQRYRTAEAMAEDLRAFLEGKPIAARLPSAMYLTRLAYHRNRTLFGAIAVLLGALLVGALLYVQQLQSSKRAEASLAYRANLAAAAASVRNAETPTAFQRLGDCPPELRGWEWDHLAQSADQSLRTLARVGEPIEAVAYHGDTLVISHRRGITVFEGDTQRSIKTPGSILDPPEVLASAPTKDGGWLAFHFRTGLWRLPAEGWAAGTNPNAEDMAATGIRRAGSIPMTVISALMPEDEVAISASHLGAVQWIDTAQMTVERSFETNLRGLNAIAFDRDSETLFAAMNDGRLAEVDMSDGSIETVLTTHAALQAVALAPDGETLAVGGSNHSIYLADRIGRRVLLELVGHGDEINALAFSPDGELLASAARDKTLRIWSTKTGQLLQTLRGHSRSAKSITFRPDGQRIVTGSGAGVVKEWAVGIAGGRTQRSPHLADVVAAGFSAAGDRFATGGREGTVRIYDADSARLDVLCVGHESELNGLVWHGDDRRMTSVDRKGSVRCWDTASGSMIWEYRLYGVVAEPIVSRNGQVVFVADFDGHVVALSAATGTVLRSKHHEGLGFSAMALGPGESTLYAGTLEGELLSLDPETFELVASAKRHAERISAIRITPDEATIVTGSFDRSLAWGKVGTLTSQQRIELGGERNSWFTDAIGDVAISPDGRLIAVASHSGLVRLVAADTGDIVLDLAGHKQWVRRVKFSPDGRTLLSTDSRFVFRLWDDRTSKVRERALRSRLEMEAAARALIEQRLGRALLDPDDFDSAAPLLSTIAQSHSELGRAATAVLHQFRSEGLVQTFTREVARDNLATTRRAAIAYIEALERRQEASRDELLLAALCHLAHPNQPGFEQRFTAALGELDGPAETDPMVPAIQFAHAVAVAAPGKAEAALAALEAMRSQDAQQPPEEATATWKRTRWRSANALMDRVRATAR